VNQIFRYRLTLGQHFEKDTTGSDHLYDASKGPVEFDSMNPNLERFNGGPGLVPKFVRLDRDASIDPVAQLPGEAQPTYIARMNELRNRIGNAIEAAKKQQPAQKELIAAK
jgi:hypothetical protein